jgi:predicted small lipoprotein YifL
MRNLTRHAAVCLAAAASVCGCGSKGPTGTTGPPGHAPAVHTATNPAAAISRRMVGAVAANKPAAAPVQVRFELRQRPSLAQPLDIDLVIVPTSPAIDRVSGTVVTDDGLDLVEGAEIAPTERPAEGVPLEHTVKVLPRRDGIFTFNAVVKVDSGGQTSTETFSMPVIAGAGVKDEPAQSAASHQAAGAAPQ